MTGSLHNADFRIKVRPRKHSRGDVELGGLPVLCGERGERQGNEFLRICTWLKVAIEELAESKTGANPDPRGAATQSK